MMLLAKTEMETENMPTDLERTDQSAQLSAQTHAPALPRPDREFVRFARHQRALHACMIVSFISLATTGLTLKFSYTGWAVRSEEHTSELQSLRHLVCRLLLEK